MGSSAITPPPPPGFVPDTTGQQSPPPPPSGFVPDTTATATQGAAPTGNLTPAQQLAAQQTGSDFRGLVKSGVSTAAGLVDFLNRYNLANSPDPTIARMTSRALEWSKPKPDEETGALVGNVGQLLLPGGVFEDLAKGLPFAERVNQAYKAIKEMGGDSILARLARMGASMLGDATTTAARGAAEVGGQTYLQTGGDTAAAGEAARQAALTGGAIGGALGGAGRAITEAGRWAEAARPGARTIAGAAFETTPRTGEPMLRNLEELRRQGQADPATQAVDEALGNIGKTGVANSLNTANAARAPETAVIPPSRQLAGGGGITIGPAAEPQPSPEGQQIAYDPRRRQIGTRVVEGPGPGQFNLPQYDPTLGGAAIERGEIPAVSEVPEGPPSRPYHREPIWQYQNEPRPGQPTPTGQTMTGPGTLIFTDSGDGLSIPRARQQLSIYDSILNDPAQMDEILPRQQARIQAARDDLNNQLRRFDDFAASQPHFAPADVLESVRNTDSIGDGAQQLTNHFGQFWERANQAARETGDRTFTDLREEEKNIRARLNSTTPTARYDDLMQQLNDNQQQQMDFFDRYRTQFSPQEWNVARQGYQDGIVMQNLDDLIQRNFGGITRAEEARGVAPRVFQPGGNFNQQLEDFYNKGFRGSATNRTVLARTIGTEHMDNLKRIGDLFENAERREITAKLSDSINTAIRRHYSGIRSVIAEAGAGAALAAHVAGHAAAGVLGGAAGLVGIPYFAGTITGTRRYIVDRLATDPDFLRRFTYAVANRLPPRTAGPLLAGRILGTRQAQQRQTAQGEQ